MYYFNALGNLVKDHGVLEQSYEWENKIGATSASVTFNLVIQQLVKSINLIQ